MRTFSFGGGVQSTAALVLAAQGRIDYREFVFANVGDDSEHPATLRYVREISVPYAEKHGLALHVVDKRRRDGSTETLYQRLMRPSRSIDIPIRVANGAPGNRTCTGDFKIKVLAKWHKQHGATAANPATVGIGISWDEMTRMRAESGIPWQRLDYPLIDLRLTRNDCEQIIREAGLPVPPKSSCWFCPFHSLKTWRKMRQDEPELFEKAADLERVLNERRTMLGKDPVWLTRRLVPLPQAADDQLAFDFEPEETHNCGPYTCTTTGAAE